MRSKREYISPRREGGYSLRGITGADELRETENGKLLLNEGIKNYV